ncbi:GNAT family N-acetyltransferase [Rhodoflexus sp.]
MYRFTPHWQINKRDWDECIAESPQRTLYAFSWYLDIVSPRWDAVVHERAGRYEAVMPLPTRKRFTFRYLWHPLFCQQLGIFMRQGHVSPDVLAAFCRLGLGSYSYAANYPFNVNNSQIIAECLLKEDWRASPDFSDIIFQPTYTHHLNLAADYAQISSHYTADRAMNLKRAERADLQIVEGQNIEPLILMFRRSAEQKIIGGIHPRTYRWLRAIYTALQMRGKCRLLYTKNNKGQLGAGALFAFDGNKIIYLFNAAFDAMRKENGRTLLLDYMFREYAGQPLIFDFESPQAASVASFYSSFGAEQVSFYTAHFNRLPWHINALWELKKKILPA